MTHGRALALIGIGLYFLRVLTSATDAHGNSLVPEALVLVSGTASLIYVIVAGVALWKRVKRIIAWALPATFLLTSFTMFLSPNPSSINLLLNAIRLSAMLTYFYAIYVLFTQDDVAQCLPNK